MEFSSLKASWEAVPLSWALTEKINTAWVDSLGEVGKNGRVREGDKIISVYDTNTSTGFLLVTGDISIQKKDAPEIVKPAPELLGEMGRLNPNQVRTADVSAATDTELVAFSWVELTTALEKRLNESEMKMLTDGLQQYAWGHFVE